MPKRTPSRPNRGRQPNYTLPQWDIPRRQRLALDERVRSLRKWLITAGLTGTVAFSLLAGHQTEAAPSAATATTTATVTTAPDSQTAVTSVFDSQSATVASTA